MKVTLSEHQIKEADRLAAWRCDQVIRRKMQPVNGESTDRDEMLKQHSLGARCEYAAWLCFAPIKWNSYTYQVNPPLPDLSDFIDVKGRRARHHRMVLQKHRNPPEWAYLLVDASAHPEYEMIAWCWGHEAKHEGFLAEPVKGREAYFVPDNAAIMKPPRALLEECRRRGAGSALK